MAHPGGSINQIIRDSRDQFIPDKEPSNLRLEKDCVEDSALQVQVAGSHYKNMAIQPAEFCQKNKLPYCESVAIRYIFRHRFKNGREDIEKAIHCLQLLLDIEYSE